MKRLRHHVQVGCAGLLFVGAVITLMLIALTFRHVWEADAGGPGSELTETILLG